MALGNIEAGTKACKIAVQLAEKQRLMASEFAPISAVYGFVFPWTSSLHSCRNHLLTGYKIGLQSGDLENAFMNITLYCFFCFSSGKPLSDLEADMRDYGRQMREYNMTLQLQFLSLTWQTILNLMGRNNDPLVLSGEVMSQEEMLQAADNDNNPPLRSQLQCHRLQLAVYFGDYELAAQLIGPASNIGTVNPANPIIWRTALFEGITAFEMVRRGKRKWKGTAMKAVTKVQKWVQAGNVNCVHILFFLQAEKAALENNIEEAQKLYDKAIATSARNGFQNDRALASERCGGMFGHAGDEDWANDYFKKAHEAYSEMEAFGKIDQMNMQRPALRPSVDIGALDKGIEKGPLPFGDTTCASTVSLF
jgi:predicted ATPase